MSGRGRGATLPAWMTNGSAPSLGGEPEIDSNKETVDISLKSTSSISEPSPNQNVTMITPTYSIPSFHNPSTTTPTTIIPPTFIPPQQNFVPKPTSFATNTFPQPLPVYSSSLGRGGNIQIPTTPGSSIPLGYNVPVWNPTAQFGRPQQLPYPMPSAAFGQIPPSQFPGYPNSAAAAAATPMQPRPTSSGPPQLAMDPNNDVKAWSEHTGTDGRIYWFNKLTAASTYEKPFCLKTPEERAIPPCPWKEYATPEGKKYYSNGTDSVYVQVVLLSTFHFILFYSILFDSI